MRERINNRNEAGLTLVELVVVVALVVLIGLLTVPGYRDQVLRAHRVEGATRLLEVAACLDQRYLANTRYDLNDCGLVDGASVAAGGAYRVTLALRDADRSFLLRAAPIGAQGNDPCGSLTLTETGETGVSVTGLASIVDACWRGRSVAR